MEISAQCRPKLGLDVDFLQIEAFGDAVGHRRPVAEQVDAEIERIGEAVSGIDAHDERAAAELREPQAGRGRQRRFADAAFSAEEKNPHGSLCIIAARVPSDLHAAPLTDHCASA